MKKQASSINSPDDINWVDRVHGPLTAWIVLGISLVVTLIAWAISNNYADRLAEERFEFQIEEAQDVIQKRFINYEQVLRGGLGLFKASNSVEHAEWREYITTLNIDEFFPGTLGVGYSKWINPDELDAYLSRIRKSGFPDFNIRPEGVRNEYSSIIFLEPFNERNQRAFGYDMYSEPVRREAMIRARDTGNTAVSGKVTLVQETSAGIQAGFLIYVPHYKKEANTVEERREALVGYVYSALRIGDLMQGILGLGLPELDFSIYDSTVINKDNLLYSSHSSETFVSPEESAGQRKYQSRFKKQKTLNIGGHSWTMIYSSNSTFDKVSSNFQPTFVAVFGVIIDLLLFYIILSLGRARKSAQALADERMKKLSERELQFEAITDNANDGIISIDDKLAINYINKSAQFLFGYDEDMVGGKSINMLFSASQHELIKRVFDQKIDAAGQLNIEESNSDLVELEGIKKNGESFPVEFSLARWVAGDSINFTAIIRDITERKRIDRVKNEFISTVSHELRTPLTAISGSLSLVENGVTGSINDQALELIKNANRNSTRLANLVNDLLDSEKMASGKMRYDIQECEIAALIKKSVEINQPVANQAGVKLSFSHEFLAHAKVIVLVDPDRFIQVMTNLLANAIKFTPVGGEVEAGLQLLVDEIRVSVTDHGSGVPEAFRANIFNKFSQADSSDTRKHGGTGLGLSIAKFIIEKFNGRIDYTSIPDKETTFFFILPVVNSSVKQNP